ncbi:SDR family oxidoreductase [Silvibacterium acidisoli]|uniref:SDR family oxidoreductase n=1 Tax=Acidobacteriaceae bacterium ZG23-2 TaxID=2883246 RepID=UPI00406C8F0C
MQISGNTILITGGASGIGRALAEALHREGNQVIIAGRRKNVLDETTAANPGMKSIVLDIENAEAIASFASEVTQQFPALNVVVHNAGIMRNEDLLAENVEDAEAMINTNLLGPIRLTAALASHLKAQPQAAILTVSSGLAFIPLAITPTYCATKAAIHSWTQSLRYQLQDTKIQVIELVPPYVQTELQGPQQAKDPNAMPLADFISETVGILKTQPDVKEVLVQRVLPLRYSGGQSEGYDGFFEKLNGMFKH